MTGLEAFILANIAVLGTSTLTANALYLGSYALIYGGLAYAASLLVPKPSVPKPEDGKYNLKQPVPPLSFALGRVKKGSDYAFLEEKDGTAYHILVWAGHRIEGYVDHYLHDEKVTSPGRGISRKTPRNTSISRPASGRTPQRPTLISFPCSPAYGRTTIAATASPRCR
jgi:hypothetical protein